MVNPPDEAIVRVARPHVNLDAKYDTFGMLRLAIVHDLQRAQRQGKYSPPKFHGVAKMNHVYRRVAGVLGLHLVNTGSVSKFLQSPTSWIGLTSIGLVTECT